MVKNCLVQLVVVVVAHDIVSCHVVR